MGLEFTGAVTGLGLLEITPGLKLLAVGTGLELLPTVIGLELLSSRLEALLADTLVAETFVGLLTSV